MTEKNNVLLDRIDPSDLEAERAVLGSMLYTNDVHYIVFNILKKDDFYYESHKNIFEAMTILFDSGVPIDVITVLDKLKSLSLLEKIGGEDYLKILLDSITTTAHTEFHAKIIKEKSILRNLIKISNQTIEACYYSNQNPEHILDASEQAIFELSQNKNLKGFEQISNKTHETIEKINSFFTDKQNIQGLRTGFFDFDKITGGLQNSNLIIVAARPAMGKTSFCLNIASYVALKLKKPVAIFSLEMSTDELVFRLLCSEARVNSHQVKNGFLPKSAWPNITNVATPLSEAPLFIDDTPNLSPLDMKTRARKLKASSGLSLIIIDYLQLMAGRSGKAEYRQQDISEITRNLKILAKELDVPVIALSQLSRATEKRPDQRPQLSDLRESGSIEQDADLVAFLYREGYYKPNSPELENKAELIIGKQRNGPTGTIDLIFRGEFTRFENASSENDINDVNIG